VVKKDDATIVQDKDKEANTGFDVTEFFKETKGELEKVVWPTRQQWVSESIVVILMVILSAMTVYFVDQLFSWTAKQVF